MKVKKTLLLALVVHFCHSYVLAQNNIAMNKPVSTSTVANATYPKLLNDGNSSTAWNSSTTSTQWIQMDLLDVFDLSNITIEWGAAAAGQYSVSTSSDNQEWTLVEQISHSGSANIKSLNISRNAVRYIRINMSTPTTGNGYSINEVQVLGNISSVVAVPTLKMAPNNELLVLGYNSPRILSLNNSLIDYNDQPTAIFNRLAASAGKNAIWEKQTRLGQTLRFHYQEGDGILAGGVPSAKHRIKSQGWTHIILQEQSNKPLTDYADFLASVKLWVEYIRTNCPNPNVRIILFMNWPFTDAVDFKGDMARLWTNYMMVAAETGVSVYPVGKAYEIILDKDGLNTKNALYTDNRHPSLMASYLSACTILAGLYELNPEGLSFYPNGLSQSQAQLMQSRAKDASLTVSNTCDIGGKIHFSAELTDQFNRPITNSNPVLWSVSGGGSIDENGTFTSNNTPGTYTATATKGSLSVSTTFEVKSVVINPVISTQAATNIASSSVTAHGNITLLGNTNPTQYGHCWSTQPNPTIQNNKTSNGIATSPRAYTSAITGLNPSTTYHVRAYVTTVHGTIYGNEISFTTTSQNEVQLATLLSENVHGTYNWTCPEGVTTVQIECWGGGGAGGGAKNLGLGSSSINANCGGGGAGGSYVKHTSIAVVPGTVYPFTVGAGGTGVIAAKGNDGGNTTFNTTTLIAFGGGGGEIATLNETNTAVIASTLGGICQTPTTGIVNFSGGKGGNSKNNTGYFSGGGGGAADANGSGNEANSTSWLGGAAGSAGGGAGGNGISGTGAMGNPGQVIGGGGAGSTTGQGDTNRAGGAGANGKIIISAVTTTGFSTQNSNNTILIYPNPAKNTIFTSTEVSELKLFTLQGQLVRTTKNANSIDVSNMGNGMYVVLFTDKSGNRHSKKVEINNH